MTEREAPTRRGKLSIVATPIGNLEDVTLRALSTLRTADLVLAEDTRQTLKLFMRHGINAKLQSFHAHSTEGALTRFKQRLVDGEHLALVTDAGTPLVSDPGKALVSVAYSVGAIVETLPGPSAVIAALTVCDLPCDVFRFVGFLPRAGTKRDHVLGEVAAERGATVIFEAPTRLLATLEDLRDRVGPERRASVCRELTKMHEEVVRGTLHELATRFALGARGEIVIVVEGKAHADGDPIFTASSADLPALGTGPSAPPAPALPVDPAEHARALLTSGGSTRDTAASVADSYQMSKRDAYALVLAVQESLRRG